MYGAVVQPHWHGGQCHLPQAWQQGIAAQQLPQPLYGQWPQQQGTRHYQPLVHTAYSAVPQQEAPVGGRIQGDFGYGTPGGGAAAAPRPPHGPTAMAPAPPPSVMPRPPGGGGVDRSLSFPSAEAAGRLQTSEAKVAGFEREVDLVEQEWRGGFVAPGAARTRLAQLESAMKGVEARDIDDVQTGDLRSGKELVRAMRKNQLAHLETLFARVEGLFAEFAAAGTSAQMQ